MQNTPNGVALSDAGRPSIMEFRSDTVELQVGEQRFVTTKATLVEKSAFFKSLLSGRWNNAGPDGSYFIDADPELFTHILRYLRRGLFPLFYDNTKGHNYSKYSELLEEARYFEIACLQKWLDEKKFLDAVQLQWNTSTVDDGDLYPCYDAITRSNGVVEFHPSTYTKRTYICPRRISCHRGKPSACGRMCDNVRGDGDDKYEEEDCLLLTVVRKETMFAMDVLRSWSAE